MSLPKELDAIICERGVLLLANADGTFSPSGGAMIEPGDLEILRSIIGTAPYRHVAARFNPGTIAPTWFLRPRDGERPPSGQVLEVQRAMMRSRGEFFELLSNLEYLLGALVYHLTRLAVAYSETVSQFSAHTERTEDWVILGGQDEQYYEFDAVTADVSRAYEAILRILKLRFGKPTISTKEIAEKFESLPGCPALLSARLASNFRRTGRQAKDYRNFVQHQGSLAMGQRPFADMHRVVGPVWSTSSRIPDNPEVSKFADLRYDGRLDMLTYAWEASCDVLHCGVLAAAEVAPQTP